jgi:Tfp pilus assembly protein FimT
MLIVVTIVGILASVMIPTLNSTSGAIALEAAARTLAADIRIARQSAVQYNGNFAVTFDRTNNAYNVKPVVSGAAPGLVNVLAPSGSGNTVDFDSFGAARSKQSRVVLAGAALKRSKASVVDLTFQPSGGTGPTRTEDTMIWLTEGTGANRRCILIAVSWITGAVTVGDVQSYPVPLTMPNF